MECPVPDMHDVVEGISRVHGNGYGARPIALHLVSRELDGIDVGVRSRVPVPVLDGHVVDAAIVRHGEVEGDHLARGGVHWSSIALDPRWRTIVIE